MYGHELIQFNTAFTISEFYEIRISSCYFFKLFILWTEHLQNFHIKLFFIVFTSLVPGLLSLLPGQHYLQVSKFSYFCNLYIKHKRYFSAHFQILEKNNLKLCEMKFSVFLFVSMTSVNQVKYVFTFVWLVRYKSESDWITKRSVGIGCHG